MTWQVLFYLICLTFLEVAAQLQYSIPEELRHGSVIGNIAKDLGISSKDLSLRKFHIVFRGKIQYFNVNLETGDISVAQRIDREAICGMKQTCLISFEAVIENPLQLYTVKVEIQDVNDNPPNFLKSTFDIVISESALPGVRLALEHAQDYDLGNNSVQKYQISDNEYFRLVEKITDGIKYPELVLEKALDREKQNQHQLVLTAMDGGQPPKTGSAFIKVSVYDANDNFPKFSKDTYQITLNENSPVGFLVLHLDAIDEDEGFNAQITYSFGNVPDDVHQMFAVDPLRGNISVIGNLDFEMTEEYKFTVEAKDGGGLVAHCKVSIQVIDINDNPPEIKVTSLITEIPEDSPPGTIVALINVHDLDTGDNGKVFCHISEKLPFQLISSSPNYYKLETTVNMDRERASEYKITITAVDKGIPQLSANKTIQLLISDINDNPPIFEKQNYILYVPENNQAGLSIHSLYSSDLDLNDNGKITYCILNSNIEDIPVSSFVSINSMTGVLYAQRSFDYEQLREFQFQVMAKDSGSPPLSSNVTVSICIIDKNDNAPKILYPSPDTEGSALFEFIPHSAEKGYLVTKVIAVDADSGHNAWLSYHLLQVPEPSLYNIGQLNGEIRIARDLSDLDSARQKIVVLVKDNGSPSLSSTVVLNIVVAENFQQVVPEIRHQPSYTESSANTTFYLVVSIGLIAIIFIVTVMVIAVSKCRRTNTPTSFGNLGGHVYPQFTLGCPSEISDTSLPFPFSYDVCVTMDSKQNEIAYLKPVQNVPTENLIDTDDSATAKDGPQTTTVQQASAIEGLLSSANHEDFFVRLICPSLERRQQLCKKMGHFCKRRGNGHLGEYFTILIIGTNGTMDIIAIG
ncbi:protocadherin gamma-B1-like [Eleutherodactylus coqui]|uniref:protocadherin gamma-B1-like n=1 Tax=Eleutherodactylus coqui TaxID=57060 RepID=UPI00346211B5